MVTRESLSGVRVVRAYNAEQYQEDKFDKENTKLTKINLFVNRVMGIMDPGMNFVMTGLSLAIYWIGAILINSAVGYEDKLLIFSDMMVYSQYAISVIMAFMMMVFMFMMLPRAQVSAVRVNEVLNTNVRIKEGNIDNSQDIKGSIIFNNVSFKYPDADDYILKNVNVKIDKGQTAAFIGSTGSGKSTLINLVPRFYDATEGEILIDGVNIKEYKEHALNEKIGYVPQKAVLFYGDIRSNIDLGDKNLLDDEITTATKIARAEDFINELDDKFLHHVAQGGTNYSGGQKQRMAIARAIALKPEILIFDDSFSALDYKTDKLLRKELDENLHETTKLIVAQRIGTIINADIIVVLEQGEVVGIGTHKELLETCEVYKEIALSQLSKEELERGDN